MLYPMKILEESFLFTRLTEIFGECPLADFTRPPHHSRGSEASEKRNWEDASRLGSE